MLKSYYWIEFNPDGLPPSFDPASSAEDLDNLFLVWQEGRRVYRDDPARLKILHTNFLSAMWPVDKGDQPALAARMHHVMGDDFFEIIPLLKSRFWTLPTGSVIDDVIRYAWTQARPDRHWFYVWLTHQDSATWEQILKIWEEDPSLTYYALSHPTATAEWVRYGLTSPLIIDDEFFGFVWSAAHHQRLNPADYRLIVDIALSIDPFAPYSDFADLICMDLARNPRTPADVLTRIFDALPTNALVDHDNKIINAIAANPNTPPAVRVIAALAG